MKKSLKITLAVVFSVILIGAFVLLTTLVAANWEYIVGSYNGETYYTSGELEEEYDKGYNDALGNGENNYKALYEEAVKNLSIAQNDKNQLTSQLAQVQSRLDQALNKQELDAETILELQTDISNLNSQITEKNNEIKYYQELLEAYKDSDKLIVSFIIPENTIETVYDVQVVNEGEYLGEVLTPEYNKGTFLGWSLTPYGETVSLSTIQITENTSIYAVFDYSLEAFSWSEIESIANNGLAETYFDIGDEKTIKLSNGESSTVAIMGFNHDNLSDSNEKAKITFGMTDILTSQYAMESTLANITGWEESTMRNETLSTIYTYLPNDLKSLIKSVEKETMNTSGSYTLTTDKLWLFSWTEIYGNLNEGNQYEYFNEVQLNQKNEILIKNLNGTNTASGWWLRSISGNGSSYQHIMSTSSANSVIANLQSGISFGFCI